jgi:hypothetical protein
VAGFENCTGRRRNYPFDAGRAAHGKLGAAEAKAICGKSKLKVAKLVPYCFRWWQDKAAKHVTNKGRGRLQVQIRRAFVGHCLLSSSQVYDYALARVRGDAWRRRHRWSVIRILRQLCHRVGRADTIGRPWLWRLKEPLK